LTTISPGPDRLGLSERDAKALLGRFGYNELPVSGRASVLRAAVEVVREPMILMLLAAGGIYLLLGDLREALVLLSSVGVVIAISLFQNRRTERALQALRDLSSPRALVIRDGVRRRIPAIHPSCRNSRTISSSSSSGSSGSPIRSVRRRPPRFANAGRPAFAS
jgi:magnesium-transporting ATPase (P-type)